MLTVVAIVIVILVVIIVIDFDISNFIIVSDTLIVTPLLE